MTKSGQTPIHDDGPFDWFASCKNRHTTNGTADTFNDAWQLLMIYKTEHEYAGCPARNIHRIIINKDGNIIWPVNFTKTEMRNNGTQR